MSNEARSNDGPSVRVELADGCRFQDFVDVGYRCGVHKCRATSGCVVIWGLAVPHVTNGRVVDLRAWLDDRWMQRR